MHSNNKNLRFVLSFGFVIIFVIIFVLLNYNIREELKREVIGKSFKEPYPDSIFVGKEAWGEGAPYKIVTMPGKYYLIVKIYYNNNTTSVENIPVDKETYDKN